MKKKKRKRDSPGNQIRNFLVPVLLVVNALQEERKELITPETVENAYISIREIERISTELDNKESEFKQEVNSTIKAWCKGKKIIDKRFITGLAGYIANKVNEHAGAQKGREK